MTNYINEVYSLDTGLFYFTLSVHTICIIRHYFNWGNTSTFLMEDIIPSITCTSLFQFCNTITYPSAGLIHKQLSRHEKIGTFIKRILAHPTGLWYFFHNGVQCLKPDTVRALPRTRSPKLICNFTPDFYWVKWSSRYSVPSLVWSNLSSINTAFLYIFLPYQITNLIEIQWNVCSSFVKLAEYNQIQRVDVHCKGLCPSYWMFRSAYPFSNIADVVVSQIFPRPGANLVEKIFKQPIFFVNRSFAKFIKNLNTNILHF